VIVAGLVAVLLSLGSGTSEQEASAAEPATVEPIKGTDLSRVTLSAQAAKRIGIETAAVAALGKREEVMPYKALLYDAEGHTYVYTSPEALVFVRHPVTVTRIDGDRAFLSSGPPVGTVVVTVGSQELFGTEYEVEED
jgi:hypothetical protein